MRLLPFVVCIALCTLGGAAIGATIGDPAYGSTIGLATGAAIASVLILLDDEAT